MRRGTGLIYVLGWLLPGLLPGAPAVAAASFRVSPAAVTLHGPEEAIQLRVAALPAPSPDLTRRVAYASAAPAVVTVDPTGRLTPRGEGSTWVIVRRGNELQRVRVTVVGLRQPVPVSFGADVIPVLTRAGCNSGACHGKAEGQNGFKLSVFGFDPAADYRALAVEGRGRRIAVTAPDDSLLLRKATSELPHGGGRRLDPRSFLYRRLRRWIAEGARPDPAPAASGAPASPEAGTAPVPVVALRVEPAGQVLALGGTLQVRAVARDAQGAERCVTAEAEYRSNAGTIAEVDRDGWVQAGKIPGEAAILVRYMGHVGICRVTVPRPGPRFAAPPAATIVDRLVWERLRQLGVPPSGPADDATYLRRVYLDTIGTLPTPAEARAFLADAARNSAAARARLVDRLLARPEYADYWAMKWADVLRVDRDVVAPEGAVAMTRWLRRQVAENRPYDQFVRDIVTAQGPAAREGPAAFYRAISKPEEMSRAVSQLFLGVRIECAQCHHHPSERWGQEDFYALAGFFSGVGKKTLPGGGEAVVAKAGAPLKHPRTGQPVSARALGASPATVGADGDPRAALADWMTGPENPYFARAVANRLWAHYFGRGLVEPVDDLRATNPAVNEPLLRELAAYLRRERYDLKALTRLLLTSRVYALSTHTRPENAADEQNFSHAAYRALPAEVLLDALCQVTGVPERYVGWPEGYRAIQVWDNRMPSYFFRVFGRPARVSVCECERSNEPSIAQALHLMNSPEITDKLRARTGVARRLAESRLTSAAIVEELVLATLSRCPTPRERRELGALFARGSRREATEDVLWALINTREFVYNR